MMLNQRHQSNEWLLFKIKLYLPGNCATNSTSFCVTSNFIRSSWKYAKSSTGNTCCTFTDLAQPRDNKFPKVSASSEFKILITLVSL